jgi:hypothetical protein
MNEKKWREEKAWRKSPPPQPTRARETSTGFHSERRMAAVARGVGVFLPPPAKAPGSRAASHSRQCVKSWHSSRVLKSSWLGGGGERVRVRVACASSSHAMALRTHQRVPSSSSLFSRRGAAAAAPIPLGRSSSNNRIHTRDVHAAAAPTLIAPVATSFFASISAASLAQCLAAAAAAAFAVFVAVSAWRRDIGGGGTLLKPRLTLSQSARLAAIVAGCPTLHRSLRPPLLLQTSLLQLAAYLLRRKTGAAVGAMWRREVLATGDGVELYKLNPV